MLDETDKRLLDIIQTEFPIAERPYQILGDQLGISEAETWDRVRNLRAGGIIRRIGANFQSSRLGFSSTLCAAHVPQEKLEEFIALVNAEPGVTHNYEREHYYNIWFTLIAPGEDAMKVTLAALGKKSGIKILNLPATRLYKIRVDFRMTPSA